MVFIPKYRRKALFGQLRKDLGPLFRDLAEQKDRRVEEGHKGAQSHYGSPSVHFLEVVGKLRSLCRSERSMHLG